MVSIMSKRERTLDEQKARAVLGASIRKRREDMGMSRRAVCVTLEKTERTLGSWEAGETVPDALELASLAKLFGCSVGDLMAAPRGQRAA